MMPHSDIPLQHLTHCASSVLQQVLKSQQVFCPPSSTPTVALLAVGNEVLTGAVTNTNASWLAKQLPTYGFKVVHHATVGDEPTAITNALVVGLQQAQGLVITGGLGPTDDDLTIATLAEAFGVPLVADQASTLHLQQWFQARFPTENNPTIPQNNWKQALIPKGAKAVINPVGTAPATVWQLPSGQWIICLPGIPREVHVLLPLAMQALNFNPVQQAESIQQFRNASVYFYGIGESYLVEALGAKLMNPTYAPYAVAPYVENEHRIRIEITSTQPQTEAQAKAFFTQWRNQLPPNVKPFCLPEGYNTLEAWVVQQAVMQGVQLATAESCTGGLVSHLLTQVSGSSAVVSGNMVTYSNAIKTQWLGVSNQTLETHGAVSQAVAIAMAQGVRQQNIQPENTVALGITGIAGPSGGSVEKPVGHVWLALSLPAGWAGKVGGTLISKAFYFNPTLERSLLKAKFATEALQLFSLALQAFEQPMDWHALGYQLMA